MGIGRISNMTLVKYAAFAGLATVTMALALRSKLNNKIKDTEYYKEALKTLRKNRGAVYLMGEPIRDGTIDVGNNENFTKGDIAQYEVPVKGTKEKGTLYFWATKENRDHWVVSRIELGLNSEPNRRLLIKKIVEDV